MEHLKFKNWTLTLLLVSFTIFSYSQSINSNWEQELTKAVDEFKQCDHTMVNNVNPCSKYLGESINKIYNVNDFYSEKLGRYLTGTEISEFIKTDSNWKELGFAYDAKVLTEANDYANAKKAVIAVHFDEQAQIGHVSIILPGEMTSSGSWGLKVPKSASFFMHSPEKSYANKALSYAFTRTMIRNVKIYGRQY